MLMSTVMPVSVKTILLEASIEVIDKKAEEHDHSGKDFRAKLKFTLVERLWKIHLVRRGIE